MNATSQWRYALAQTVAPIYAANLHVAAVLVVRRYAYQSGRPA